MDTAFVLRETPGRKIISVAAAFLSTVLLSCDRNIDAAGQNVAEFYRGRTVEIIVGFTPGGTSDQAARVLARHIGKHIPGNPSVVVRNQPGAGSLLAANTLNLAGPKDGTAIGIFSDTAPFSSIWNKEAKFDARHVGWLGAITKRGTSMLLVRRDAPATTVEGLRKISATVGATGPDSPSSAYAKLANDILGTKLKIILGYTGSADVYLAVERGEIDGTAGANLEIMRFQRPDWIPKGFAIPVVLLSLYPDPALPGVRPIIDFAGSREDRDVMELVLGTQQFGRTFSVPGDVPPERLAALRQAFRATVVDQAFLNDAKESLQESITISHHGDIEAYVAKAYAFPQKIRDRASLYVGSAE